MRKCAVCGGGTADCRGHRRCRASTRHQAGTGEQERLAAERHAALREAFSRLSPGCQRLLTLLIDDPPVPDAEISARLGIPVGSIGPACRRCLEKLRRDPVIAALAGGTAPWQTPGRAGG
jgi:DNA-directed RNA polymerase specialized sigma24 family protein